MYVTFFYESTKNHDVIISAKTGDFIIMSTLFLRPLVKVILNGKPITDVLKKRQPFFSKHDLDFSVFRLRLPYLRPLQQQRRTANILRKIFFKQVIGLSTLENK